MLELISQAKQCNGSAEPHSNLMILQYCVSGECVVCGCDQCVLERQTKVHEDFTIMEKAPTWAFS